MTSESAAVLLNTFFLPRSLAELGEILNQAVVTPIGQCLDITREEAGYAVEQALLLLVGRVKEDLSKGKVLSIVRFNAKGA